MSIKRVYAEIDLSAIQSNMEHMNAMIDKHTKIIAVIKADGYGHGALQIAQKFECSEYVFGYATATVEEAVDLRENNIKKPILILGYTFPEDYESIIKYEISPAVFKAETARQLSACAEKMHKKVHVHIKVETGMSRIGVSPDDRGLSVVKEIAACPWIEVEGMFTHFARADEKNKSYAKKQYDIFQRFTEQCAESGVHPLYLHCSNSAGILEIPWANMDLVRAGITMYGLWPSDEVSRDVIDLIPAMTIKSTIVYIKTLPKGVQISYGGTYTTEKTMRIATIPVGYADGYPRGASNKGDVLIRGMRAPIVGRVCMDQFMVDVTDIPGVQEYDEVVLLGSFLGEKITAEEIGNISGRFNYELVCDISGRVPRIYK